MSEPWHIKREIQLGHILTTVTVAASAVIYVGKLEQRIALVEQQIGAQHERDDRQDRAVSEALAILRAQLERMETKLDKVLERR